MKTKKKIPAIKDVLNKSSLTKDVVQAIRASTAVYNMAKEGKAEKTAIDCETIDFIRDRYEGLVFSQLLLLWHENYHTMTSDKHHPKNTKRPAVSLSGFLTTNKTIAIGMLLDEGW